MDADHALKYVGYLLGAAGVCFVLAMFNGILMPGPADAPIDRIFRTPGAAWILFAFGVTLAPFFEELAFRGFLLPALSTAFDWIAEKSHRRIAPSPRSVRQSSMVDAGHDGRSHHHQHPLRGPARRSDWLLARTLSAPCLVSLVLCGVRLALRSLAASVLVHATYNFLLFSFMFFGTSGFRHLENM